MKEGGISRKDKDSNDGRRRKDERKDGEGRGRTKEGRTRKEGRKEGRSNRPVHIFIVLCSKIR
jgi:hypothetical protein